MNYCTLFDSNYLDKAIVMIESLKRQDQTAKVFVLCMDKKAFDILTDIGYSYIELIALEQFEDQELLTAKANRSRGEYCWSCTAKLIYYVLINYKVDTCTYVDADLYFLSNPVILIDEMKAHGCCVQVIKHNFPNTTYGRKLEKESGKFCVQFNTFTNSEDSINLLLQWVRQCLEKCSVDSAGDQMYTNDWDIYEFVNVSGNEGAGVAPWNICRFIGNKVGEKYFIKDRNSGNENEIVFYHFQNVVNKERYFVNVYPLLAYWIIDQRLTLALYTEYLKKIEAAKEFIHSKYDFLPIVNQYISEGKRGARDYIIQILNHPIKSIPLITHRISSKVLGKMRRNVATIDVRRLKEEE